MPTIAKVTKAYAKRGVAFYAVNLMEDAATVRKFLNDQKIQCAVALDEQGKVGKLYKADGIPQTVIIDKQGVVQVVHVGLLPNLETRLKTELDAVLAGKNLAAKAAKQTAAPASSSTGQKTASLQPQGLEQQWTVAGQWTGVAFSSANGTAYATATDKQCMGVNANGKVSSKFALPGVTGIVRIADLTDNDKPELITFGSWGHSVQATDCHGKLFWRYPGGDGIDDVWTADLNDNGLDEVIVGYNGGTGLHVLDNRGKLLWKYTGIGNVWHVCAGDVNGDGVPEVVTTSAEGEVHVFDRDGKKLKDLATNSYTDMVRLARLPKEKAEVILAGGTGQNGHATLVCLTFAGEQLWSLDLPMLAVDFIDSAFVSSSRPWMAIAMRGGLINVVDLVNGKVIAHVGQQGMRPEVGWMERKGESPLLLVATGSALNAFRITGSS